MQASATSFVDEYNPSSLAYQSQFVSNNHSEGRKVLSSIEHELKTCTGFTFSVAFITMSGIVPLLQTLEELEQLGIPGRILTTDYLAFSDPLALRKLDEFSNIEVRVFLSRLDSSKTGFHTKGYYFEHEDGHIKAIIGSSNMTGAALAINKEWNVKLVGTRDGKLFKDLHSEFMPLWNAASPLSDVIDAYEQMHREKQMQFKQQPVISIEQARLEPNKMQVRFIEGLDAIIESGGTRALLISATGTGKTYASAFAVRHMDPKRVLFLAHREQLLKQSITSYKNVFGSTRSMGLVSGNSRDTDNDFMFATMQTMSKDYMLHGFEPDEFDMVIIDEVHRAGAKSYEKILDYFDAEFYLGMTASPDRPDGFDIYGLFDNNIAYEIRLQGALEEGLLCPFHYFGITEIFVDGHLLGDGDIDNFSLLASDERVDRIIEKSEFYGYSGDRPKCLVFCSTNREAAELARMFNGRGRKAIALSGSNTQDERIEGIERLVAEPGDKKYDDRVDYIFTVDIFNEGVDIPEVNQVIMLRPTESPIVFVQQLGRGLRNVDGKEFVVVLDFIGNYANNYMIPLALSGDRSYSKDAIRKYVLEGSRTIPGVSTVHFDEISRKKIFESIDNSKVTLRMLKEKYVNLRHKLGRVPKLVDFLDHAEIDPMLIVASKGSYQNFLMNVMDEEGVCFTAEELNVLQYLSEFIMSGMRPHEILMLKEILFEGEASAESVKQDLFDYFDMSFSEDDYDSACRVLGMDFAVSQQALRKYDGVEIIDEDSGKTVFPSHRFAQLLSADGFRLAILDMIEFSLRRFDNDYRSADDEFKLYEKYTRRDVCWLLDWDHDESSTMYGYRVKYGTCPIFVTYEKQDDISKSTQYEDRFMDAQTFSWMTRSNLSINSKEVQEIIHADETGLDIRLFIKKHDSEGSSFYYLGKVHPRSYQQKSIENDKGQKLPIVNFVFDMEQPVRTDIYEYFIEG